MLVVRPAELADRDSFIALARQAGPGFTSLAVSDDILVSRLEKSVKSFASKSKVAPENAYLLMLEDSETGKIVGTSALKAQIGATDPFFNFRILKLAQKSAVTNKRYDMDLLMVVNEHDGASEVGTLFVPPEMRGTGAGRLISQARYMFIAGEPTRFSKRVISELRGVVDEHGSSPFWDAIGRKFFLMDFTEADSFSAEQDSQFILDLMPKYPIYAKLLPDEARAVMGKTHPAGVGARRFLEAEGFRYDGLIDIFDGGPSMSAPRDDIRTVKQSRVLTAEPKERVSEGQPALISNNRADNFRCVFSSAAFQGGHIGLDTDVMAALQISNGDDARVWIKR